MEALLKYVNALDPFSQGLIATAVFAVSSWMLQRLLRKAKSSGSEFMRVYSQIDVLRHLLHKEYVRTGEYAKATYGTLWALLEGARWVMRGMLIAVFFIGVHSIINQNWLFVAASWFCFNCFLEAYNWLKDSSDQESISHVPDEIRGPIFQQFYGAEKRAEPDQIEGSGS